MSYSIACAPRGTDVQSAVAAAPTQHTDALVRLQRGCRMALNGDR
jgi:hypothetical protein